VLEEGGSCCSSHQRERTLGDGGKGHAVVAGTVHLRENRAFFGSWVLFT